MNPNLLIGQVVISPNVIQSPQSLPDVVNQMTVVIVQLRKENQILKQSNQKLIKALKTAKEHLEYCNYGNKWEKECAVAQKLPELIEEVLQIKL